VGLRGAERPGDVVEGGSLAGLRRVSDQQAELVWMVAAGLNAEVGAAADQGTAGDKQLGEDRDGVSLGVGGD
jgi:hypothetical protein